MSSTKADEVTFSPDDRTQVDEMPPNQTPQPTRESFLGHLVLAVLFASSAIRKSGRAWQSCFADR